MDKGDTSWLMISSILVLMMNTPGLAMYFGGFSREKNLVTVIMHTFSVASIVTFAYLSFGYSLAFSPVNASQNNNLKGLTFLGNEQRFWLTGLTANTIHQSAPTIPESVFCFFELSFAIVTAALLSGSFEGRVKAHAMLLYLFCWHICVYAPIAHWNWHPSGFLKKAGVLDFAGGNDQ